MFDHMESYSGLIVLLEKYQWSLKSTDKHPGHLMRAHTAEQGTM